MDTRESSFVSSTSSFDNSNGSSDEAGRKPSHQLADLLIKSQQSPSSEPRPKMPTGPQERTSDDYLKKRARNNLAVKKSRDRSKKRIVETQERVEQLTRENDELNQKVTLLSKELSVLRALFTNGGFTVPCNLQIVAQNPVAVSESRQEENSPKPYTPTSNRIASPSSSNKNHTSVIRTATTNARPCHGVILVTEPGKMNLDIQAGIQFKDERP